MFQLNWKEILDTGITAISLTIMFRIVYLISKKRQFFRDRNVPFIDSFFIFGSCPGTAIHRNPASTWTEIYHKLEPHKVGGFYELFLKPMYMVRDPEYIQLVLNKDFNHFNERGFKVDVETNPMDDNLFLLGGFKWKYIRSKLSPIFTLGRLKWMHEEMSNIADRCILLFEKNIPKNVDVNLHDLMNRFSLDVIGSTVFGIEYSALESSDCQFKELAAAFFEPNLLNGFFQFFRLALPGVLKALKVKTIDPEATRLFTSLIKDGFKHRTENNYSRKDIIQLLLEIYQKGDITCSSECNEVPDTPELKTEQNVAKVEITEELLAAQAFIFFMAGHESTSNTMHNTLYFLSINAGVQDKLRDEVRRVFAKHGSFSYDALKDMKYMHLCIKETLRVLPLIPNNTRECTADYTFPNGVEIKKGDLVVIPTYALHLNPVYFPEPNKYYPERFENPPPRGVHTPWGDGPKGCIGKRFAEMEIKMVIARIIMKFRLLPSDDYDEKTAMDLELQPNSLLTYPKKKFFLKVQRID